MPINVPTIDPTATPFQPLASPSVVPMRNEAPEQLQRTGQAVQQAGDVALRTGNEISDAVNTQVDLANVKQKVASVLSQVNDINNDPSTGFLNQRGQNAVDGFVPAKQAVDQAYEQARRSLSNPIQQRMFDASTQQDQLGVREQMQRHTFQQTAQMSAEADLSAASLKVNNAGIAYKTYGYKDGDGNPTGDFETNLSAAEQLTLNALGVLKGAPADSPVAQEAVLKVRTQAATAVLSQMMSGREPFTAVQRAFDDMKQRGLLDVQATDSLGQMVKRYTEQEGNAAKAIQNLSDAQRSAQGQPTSQTGTPNYRFAVPGAAIVAQPFDPKTGMVTINAPTGSDVKSPDDGVVTGVGSNDDGNALVQIQHPDGSVTTLSELNAINVKPGDKVQGGENIGTAAGAMRWSLADKGGNAVDPTKAGLGPVDLSKITDANVLQTALQTARAQTTDPRLQDQIVDQIQNTVRRNQQEATVGATQRFGQASDQFYKAGMKVGAIDPGLFSQLDGEQQQHFRDLEKDQILKNYDQANRFKEMSSTDLQLHFIQHPEDLTPEALDAQRSKLPPSVFLSLSRQAQDNSDSGPAGQIKAHLDLTQVNDLLNQNGMNNLADPKTTQDKETSIALRKNITDLIQNEQDTTGKQVTRQRKEEIINNVLTDQVSRHNTFLPDDTGIAAFRLGVSTDPNYAAKNAYVTVNNQKVPLSAVPPADREKITAAFIRQNKPTTQQNIVQLWADQQAKLGKKVPTL